MDLPERTLQQNPKELPHKAVEADRVVFESHLIGIQGTFITWGNALSPHAVRRSCSAPDRNRVAAESHRIRALFYKARHTQHHPERTRDRTLRSTLFPSSKLNERVFKLPSSGSGSIPASRHTPLRSTIRSAHCRCRSLELLGDPLKSSSEFSSDNETETSSVRGFIPYSAPVSTHDDEAPPFVPSMPFWKRDPEILPHFAKTTEEDSRDGGTGVPNLSASPAELTGAVNPLLDQSSVDAGTHESLYHPEEFANLADFAVGSAAVDSKALLISSLSRLAAAATSELRPAGPRECDPTPATISLKQSNATGGALRYSLKPAWNINNLLDWRHSPLIEEQPAAFESLLSPRARLEDIPCDLEGKLLSIGSIGHATGGCKPCVFFHNPEKGCKNGVSCQFCHHEHPPKKRVRLSRKKRNELKALAAAAVEDAANYGDSETLSGSVPQVAAAPSHHVLMVSPPSLPTLSPSLSSLLQPSQSPSGQSIISTSFPDAVAIANEFLAAEETKINAAIASAVTDTQPSELLSSFAQKPPSEMRSRTHGPGFVSLVGDNINPCVEDDFLDVAAECIPAPRLSQEASFEAASPHTSESLFGATGHPHGIATALVQQAAFLRGMSSNGSAPRPPSLVPSAKASPSVHNNLSNPQLVVHSTMSPHSHAIPQQLTAYSTTAVNPLGITASAPSMTTTTPAWHHGVAYPGFFQISGAAPNDISTSQHFPGGDNFTSGMPAILEGLACPSPRAAALAGLRSPVAMPGTSNSSEPNPTTVLAWRGTPGGVQRPLQNLSSNETVSTADDASELFLSMFNKTGSTLARPTPVYEQPVTAGVAPTSPAPAALYFAAGALANSSPMRASHPGVRDARALLASVGLEGINLTF